MPLDNVIKKSYLFRAIVVVMNDKRFLGMYPTFLVVHSIHFALGVLFTFWWALPLFIVYFNVNPLWFLFPFRGIWDYLLWIEWYAQWRTNVVMSGLHNVMMCVMLSEAGYSSTVLRAKLPLFRLTHSRRQKIISLFFNAPFALPKLSFTIIFYVLIWYLMILSPLTNWVTVVYTAPSIGFLATETYLKNMRQFPYYISKRFFAGNRQSYYNLGLSMSIPRNVPMMSFVFGYLEVFEVSLFAIDMERQRENHRPRFVPQHEPKNALSDADCQTESEVVYGLYATPFTDPTEIPVGFFDREMAKAIIKFRERGMRYDETYCKEAYRILKEEYGIIYPDAMRFPLDDDDNFDWLKNEEWQSCEIDGVDFINLFGYGG